MSTRSLRDQTRGATRVLVKTALVDVEVIGRGPTTGRHGQVELNMLLGLAILGLRDRKVEGCTVRGQWFEYRMNTAGH